MRYNVAIRFGIGGDLRYISHHDTMRLFERALCRAQLPVKFSGGFNPRPRLSLPLPRAVGIESEAELLLVGMDQPIEPAIVFDQLAGQMPTGLALTDAWEISEGCKLRVDLVEYMVEIPADRVSATIEMLECLLAADTWLIKRTGVGGKPDKTIDLRAYLTCASIDEGQLRWTLRVTGGGAIRPAEMLSALGLDCGRYHHRVRRTAIHLLTEPPGTASSV